MTTETIIVLILVTVSNVLCICLGYWMGMVKVGQAIPAIKLPAALTKKPKSYLEDDPYSQAMADKPEERKETIK